MLLIAIFIGGGLGATLRHLFLEIALYYLPHKDLPLVIVNALGSILAGVLLGYYLDKQQGVLFSMLLIGCLGGFTTFSSFALSIVQTYSAHGLIHSLSLLLLHNGLAIAGCAIGHHLLK